MIGRGLLALVLFVNASAQLPPSEHVSAEDERGFHAELQRLNALLPASSDKCSIEYQIARTWAAGGQYPEAIDWLRRVVAQGAGFDPSRDAVFTKLRGVREFEKLVLQARQSTYPVSHSTFAFRIPASDQFPENLAWDPRTKRFWFGSTYNNTIIRCSVEGRCATFASDTGLVLGLKVDASPRVLWATSNRPQESGLVCYRLDSGAVVRKIMLTGRGHNFNDLAISPSGDVFVTDTAAAAVYRLRPGRAVLERIAPGSEFTAANGIALSQDGTKLYVADFGDGIAIVDLRSGEVRPLAHPSGVCLGYIDGLYFHEKNLIAIQNGFMSPRVVRFVLTPDGRGIRDMEVLERRNPLFDGVTTGVIVGHEFFYMANNQIDKVRNGRIAPGAHLAPITILKLDPD